MADIVSGRRVKRAIAEAMMEGGVYPMMDKGLNPHKYKVTDSKGQSLEPDEFFVLRRGDALSIATLRSYAANALMILEIESVGLMKLDHETRSHLLALADDVSDLAAKWEHDESPKLPD